MGSAVVSLILGFLEDKDSYFEIFIEPSVILLILIANAIVGVWQESSAEEAIEVTQSNIYHLRSLISNHSMIHITMLYITLYTTNHITKMCKDNFINIATLITSSLTETEFTGNFHCCFKTYTEIEGI